MRLVSGANTYHTMLSIKAHAKINLYLDVISRYPNGYHQIESVMQSISLHDLIEISPAQELIVSCTEETLSGEENLAFRAALELRKQAVVKAGASLNIIKHIPVAAGLAGGSADAAAALTGLNILWGLNLPREELQGIGAGLGADIPFCLAGGTLLAQGKGDILTKLNPMPDTAIVVITPPLHVSTAEIYHAIDEERPAPLNAKDTIVEALSGRDLGQIAVSLDNLLETVALKRYPAISRAKQLGVTAGGIGALMSGSGPTVFILCEDLRSANTVADSVKSAEPEFFVNVAKPFNNGIEVLWV